MKLKGKVGLPEQPREQRRDDRKRAEEQGRGAPREGGGFVRFPWQEEPASARLVLVGVDLGGDKAHGVER